MEKHGSSSGELQCVGRLEIEKPKPVGFLCGSIPVTMDAAFRDFSSAAIVPSQHTAPRYRMIPTETDLSALPLLPSIPEKVIPIAATSQNARRGSSWEDEPIKSSHARKGEALAVSGLVEYEDEIDVIAPADVLKQIFKIPYSKARVSDAVHRIGRTLILNSGPDAEEGERLIRRQNRQPKCVDQSLFFNFAMHSVRMEACDCPPAHKTPSDEQSKTSYDDQYRSNDGPSDHPIQGHGVDEHLEDNSQVDGHTYQREHPHGENKNLFLGKKKKKSNKAREALKVSEVREKQRCSVQESEKCTKVGDDGFLRVLLWQFHNFRMLLGSDLLIFSNEKYIAVSLHLWDVSRKVTPMAWLDAWLDNFIASVPELAICYHREGVVQGYELLKTDDIFLLKGVSDEGIPAFHPHIVQQNGLSVMRFLEDNCKQDPGAYWLYKSAGEDVVQLFDLSVIPKNQNAGGDDASSSSLQSYVYSGRSDSMLSLGTLLYRIAHRLSLSMSANKRARCIQFFNKCLSFLDEPDHLVVRALAHEQFARLLLTHEKELELAFVSLPVESEVTIAEAEEETFEFMPGLSEPNIQDIVCRPPTSIDKLKKAELQQNLEQEDTDDELAAHQSIPPPQTLQGPDVMVETENSSSVDSSNISLSNLQENLDNVVQDVPDSLSPKLAAVHHVSQAIKSLRWTRQLQTSRPDLSLEEDAKDDQTSKVDFSVCACGDPDCIEVCDIREWLPTSKIDDKLWKLVLLLGESYLALAEAYKDDGQLYQALKVVELSCLLYGSMPQDTTFISSMVFCSLTQMESEDSINGKSSAASDVFASNGLLSPDILFWSKAWTLVGDVYIEFYLRKGQIIMKPKEIKDCDKGLRMSSQVLEEVVRLKEKMGKFNQNCRSCSLINCSCRSDRLSSGNSASISNTDVKKWTLSKKQRKKLHGKNSHISLSREYNDGAYQNQETSAFEHEQKKHHSGPRDKVGTILNAMQEMDLATANAERAECSQEAAEETPSGVLSEEKPAKISGGIFKYLRGSISGDAERTFSVAMSCYEEAQKALEGSPSSSTEVQSILKKKGWVCNELGRYSLEMKDSDKAENAFSKAIDAFRQVKDHTNVILINCNLGHGRRALAEEIVPKIESLKTHPMFQSAYLQALKTAKLQYSEALRYYGAAKAELSSLVPVETSSQSSNLKYEVLTQFAHTYLKLGMLLAREDTTCEVYGNVPIEDSSGLDATQTHIDRIKHEISANDAIREALAVYESLGELLKQEAAFAQYQLACYQRDCCLKYLTSDQNKSNMTKGENSLNQKVKQYASLADKNWQRSSDFYGPDTHPVMFLTILLDQSDLLFKLSSYLHSSTMLESAFTRLLDARHASQSISKHCGEKGDVCAKFWSQLQLVLKNILTQIHSSKANKNSGDARKYSELYKISLKSTEFSQLHTMHSLWMA